jgi:uncharacterized membrane protein
MKELVVLGFASRQLAEEARARIAELDRQGALNLDGAALAYRRHDGRVEVVQPMRLAPVGAATGAVSGGQWFLRQVDETLEPSREVLFVVVSGGDPERAIEALQPLDPRVLRTTLDPAAEPSSASSPSSPKPHLSRALRRSPHQLRSDQPRIQQPHSTVSVAVCGVLSAELPT